MRVPSIPGKTDGPLASEKQTDAADPAVDRRPPGNANLNYLKRLWRAEAPLARVFWCDMAVIGTLVNVAAIVLAVLVIALGASTGAGIAIFAAPMPYNIFLVAAVWRRADRETTEWAWPARIGSLAWLLLAFLI